MSVQGRLRKVHRTAGTRFEWRDGPAETVIQEIPVLTFRRHTFDVRLSWREQTVLRTILADLRELAEGGDQEGAQEAYGAIMADGLELIRRSVVPRRGWLYRFLYRLRIVNPLRRATEGEIASMLGFLAALGDHKTTTRTSRRGSH